MQKTNQDYKKASLELLSGFWGPAIFISLLVVLLANGAEIFSTTRVEEVIRDGQTIRRTVDQRNGFLGLVNFLLAGPVYYGMASFFLRLKREREGEVKEILAGLENFLKYFLANLVMTIFIILWSLLLLVPGVIAYYRYAMTYFIMRDQPELTFMQAIERSKQMMMGNKMALFRLQLSFIGWFFLSVLTAGIGFVPLNAYYQGAKVTFYEDLLAAEDNYE